MKLFLNDSEIPISEEEKVALTLTVDSLESASTLNASYSNTFELAYTQELRSALGDIQAGGSGGLEYTKITARVEFDSYVFNGFAEVRDTSRLKVVLIAGLADIFALLGDKTLQELDKADLTTGTNRTVGNVDSGLTNDYTSRYAYAVADFGDNPGGTLDIDNTFPFPFYHTVIRAVGSSIGYTVQTDELLADAFFRKCAVAWNGSRYNEDAYFYVDLQGQVFSSGGGYILVYNATDEKIGNPYFGRGTGNDGMFFDEQLIGKPITLVYEGDLTITNTTGFYEYNVRIAKYANGVGTPTVIASFSSGRTAAASPTSVSFSIASTMYDDLAENDVITAEIQFVEGNNLTFDGGHFRSDDGRDDYTASTGFSKTNIYATPPSADPVEEPLAFLPDMLCTDFLKAVAQQFCVRYDVDTVAQTITARKFADYAADTSTSPDWSDKVNVENIGRREVQYGKYAQANFLKYKNDDTVPKTLGQGIISINQDTLEGKADIVTLPFGATVSAGAITDFIYAVYIPVIVGSGYTDEDLSPRCVFIEPAASGSVDVTDGTSTNTVNNPNVAYFAPSTADFDNVLAFGGERGLIAKYYPEFAAMIQQMQYLELELNLNGQDFAELDLFRPVYINFSTGMVRVAGFFLIQKVDEYDGKNLVRLELINLNIT